MSNKKINGFFAYVLLSVFFSSCVSGEMDNSKGDKIVLIEPQNEVLCRYTTSGFSIRGNLLVHEIMFIDSCGKYKIGDVVCVGIKN
jgi:hypothetical protein